MSLVRIAIYALAGAALLGRARRKRRSHDDRSHDGASSPNGGDVTRTRVLEVDPVGDGSGPVREERRPRKRGRRRRLAVVLMLAGIVLVGYAAATVVWRDPITDLYARWQQQRLDDALAASIAEFT